MKHKGNLINLHFKLVSYRSKTFQITIEEHQMSGSVIFKTKINWLFYNKSYLKKNIGPEMM